MKTVAVVGAGISGLLSAYFLRQKGYIVTVFERAPQVGGKLSTHATPYGIAERAANAILSDALVEEVCETIGVPLISTLSASKARYIYSQGRPRRWPLGLVDTWTLFLFLLKKPWLQREALKNKTLATWLGEYLPQRVINRVFTPACQGIFGMGTESLSATLIMNYFFNKKKMPKGKLKGSVSAPQGMGQIVKTLKAYLESQSVRFVQNEVVDLKTMATDFQEVVLATDVTAAAELLTAMKDHRGPSLASVPTVDLVSVNAFWEKSPLPFAGFGILFPRGEGIQALGVLQNHFIFPNRSDERTLSETWIYRLEDVGEDVLDTLRLDREKLFKTSGVLKDSVINKWPKALPLYGVELERVLEHFPPGHPRVHLMGNYLGEIGLNRLFARAKQLAQEI